MLYCELGMDEFGWVGWSLANCLKSPDQDKNLPSWWYNFGSMRIFLKWNRWIDDNLASRCSVTNDRLRIVQSRKMSSAACQTTLNSWNNVGSFSETIWDVRILTFPTHQQTFPIFWPHNTCEKCQVFDTKIGVGTEEKGLVLSKKGPRSKIISILVCRPRPCS